MPTAEHLILCGEPGGSRGSSTGINLSLHGKYKNIFLKISDISKPLLANIPNVLVDLLEVASYVYAADAAISRGGPVDANMGARWRRRLHLRIPVRQPQLWASESISSALVDTLSFLSDDNYNFEFVPLAQMPDTTAYFEFGDHEAAAFVPDTVMLFSGGLDSVAGCVERPAVHGEKLALVSHRSSTKVVETQRFLAGRLQKRFGPNRILHIPVHLTLDGGLTKEYTHRSRSFLFAALGTVVARLFGANSVSFFENGVTSLNLPTVGQVVGARASRTTHPRAIAELRRLISALTGRAFEIDNPFAWLTKTEVVARLEANGCGDLIRHTRSCSRVHESTIMYPHCGHCSQCLDRRFAVIAAGQELNDPAEGYKTELFSDERPVGSARELALAYVRSASTIKQMTDIAFFSHYGETSRLTGLFPETTNSIGSRIFDLYKRHAAAVCQVFDDAVRSNAPALREGTLHPNCLLALIVRNGDASYITASHPPVSAVEASPEIRLSIDTRRKRVLMAGLGLLAGESAGLIIALAEPFRTALRRETAPEEFPFTKSVTLMTETQCDNEEGLRRRVTRCRAKIEKLARDAGVSPPTPDAVIESLQWHGYRLNPNRVRLVDISQLREAEPRHAFCSQRHAIRQKSK